MDRLKMISMVIVLLFLSIDISSCKKGGSGGGGGGAPFIAAELDSFPTGSVPPGFVPSGLNSYASVYVLDDNTGSPITNAAVSVNGVLLTYNAADQDYEGVVNVNPGDSVTLTVTVRGTAYTVSGTQYTSYPVISYPTPSMTWSGGNRNPITWSGGAPLSNYQYREFYVLGVLDSADPAGNLVWPEDNYLREVSISSGPYNYYEIPANTLTAGHRQVLVGIGREIPLASAAYGSAMYVLGYNYVPVTVDNWGSHWTVQPAGTSLYLSGVASNGTTYVAVGGAGIFTSSDGVAWTSRSASTTGSLYNVIWTGTQFVAVGSVGTFITSPDGITWTPRSTGTYYTLTAVAWSGTKFVAVGELGTIITSPDGNIWTSLTPTTSSNFYGITWSGTQFVAVGTGMILTSPDGTTWTAQTVSTSYGLYSVAWSGTQFVVVGEMSRIFSSLDGVTWTPQTSGFSDLIWGVIWAGTHFIAVGNHGEIFTSSDGMAWVRQTSGTIAFLNRIAWSGSQLVVVGNGAILTAP